MRFLQSTGNAVRVGILVALVWSGVLWGWNKIATVRAENWFDARSEYLKSQGVGDEFVLFLNPEQRAVSDGWEKENPFPGNPMVFWPDGVRAWGLVLGAYVCLVVIAQLWAGNRGGPVEAARSSAAETE